MIRSFAKYLGPVSALQVALLILSVLWCGESDCLQTGKAEDCSSLVCVLLSKDAPPAQDFSLNSSSACSCVCHLKALASALTLTSPVEVLTPLSAVGPYEPIDLPSEPIIRPPVAA
jgi:hypothetical protein